MKAAVEETEEKMEKSKLAELDRLKWEMEEKLKREKKRAKESADTWAKSQVPWPSGTAAMSQIQWHRGTVMQWYSGALLLFARCDVFVSECV
eukprot:1195576-Prorocentrum_minimum.AAC.17